MPPELAGRDALLDEVARAMRQVLDDAEGARPLILSGLRGVGKTVLLNEIIRQARTSSRWSAVKIEATADRPLANHLLRELHTELRKLATPSARASEVVRRALRTFRSFQLRLDPAGNYSFGFEVQPEPGVAESGSFDRDLAELLDSIGHAARELGNGVLIAVDELQDAPRRELNGINLALHDLGQDAWPVPLLFVGAGLPSLPSVLADATSYAERLYDFRTLGLLDDTETVDALRVPAERLGVHWDEDALDLALHSSGGYPYFVQTCGKHVWDVRTDDRRIDLDDARLGVDRARDEIDRGLYQSRFDRATPAQRLLMRAMAVDGGRPSAIQDLVTRTGKTRPSDLSVSRGELIKSGQIYASDRGFLAFTVPGMSDFIDRKVHD